MASFPLPGNTSYFLYSTHNNLNFKLCGYGVKERVSSLLDCALPSVEVISTV